MAGIGGQSTPVTLASGALLGVDASNANGTVAYAGVIANTAAPANILGFVKVGGGAFSLSAAQTYTGGTTISGGMLQFANPAAMPSSGTVTLVGNSTIGVNVGGAGEFAATGSSSTAGTLPALMAGLGGQGAPVTLLATSSIGIDTTNAAGTVLIDYAYNLPASTIKVGLVKLGTGTLELTNGGDYTGAGGPGFPFVVRQGTLQLNGGTHTVTGEAVVGGTFTTTNGSAGYNATLQIDGGAFNITGTNWLSVGRGNGIGGVSSDLIVNNAATVSAGNFSAGYNGGSASNLPKGSITLNNTSSLSITAATGDNFKVGESTGSSFTMTLNDSATLSVAGTGAKYIGQGGTGFLNVNGSSSANFGTGSVRIGGDQGTGTMTINTTGTVNLGTATSYVGYRRGVGTLNMTSGTLTGTGEMRVGGSDSGGTQYNGTGTFNMNGGTVTVGGLYVARGSNNQNTMTGVVNVNGGELISSQDVTLGYAGNNNLGKMVINAGTVQVGTNATKWFKIGQWDTSKGQLDINGGNLNLNMGTSIKMASDGNTGANVVNQNGGNVTFYSNYATTIGGGGNLDLQRAGGAASNNTYNLNGGVLTVPQVVTSQTNTANQGTRTFNFNGGTLRSRCHHVLNEFGRRQCFCQCARQRRDHRFQRL